MTAERTDNEMEVMFRNSLDSWADQGSLSPERSNHLSSIVHTLTRQEKTGIFRRFLPGSIATTAVFVLVLLGLVPGVRSWAVDHFPMIGKYISEWSKIEKGWKWAEKHQMFQEVLAVSKNKGYIFRVHRVLADPTQTTIIYSVEGTNPADIELDPQNTFFEGKRFIGGLGGRGDLIDGVLVGSIEIDPLPEESGTLELVVRKIGKVEGTWDVSFEVNRNPLGEMTRTIKVNQNVEMSGGLLTVEELILSPAQTVVKLFYKGSGPGPDLDTVDNGVRLISPEGAVKPRGARGNGSRTLSGEWEQEYQFDFQRLDPVPAYVTFEFSGRIYRMGETRIPLEEGKSVLTPAGQKITVDNVVSNDRHGQIVLKSDTGKTPWPVNLGEWKVLDNKGDSYLTRPLNRNSSSSTAVSAFEKFTGVTTQELEWELPYNRTAAALVNPGYWESNDKLGKVQINIPPK